MKYGRVVNIEFNSKEDLVMFRNIKNTPAEVPNCGGFKGAPMIGEEEIDACHSDCKPYANFGRIYLKA